MIKLIAILIALLGLAGCAIGPGYRYAQPYAAGYGVPDRYGYTGSYGGIYVGDAGWGGGYYGGAYGSGYHGHPSHGGYEHEGGHWPGNRAGRGMGGHGGGGHGGGGGGHH